MLTIIQCFSGKIDTTSILNILSVFGDREDYDYKIIHEQTYHPPVKHKYLSYAAITDTNQAIDIINTITNETENDYVLFINGAGHFRPGFKESVIEFAALNDAKFMSIDSTFFDPTTGVETSYEPYGKLTFDRGFKIIKQKANNEETILSPSISLWDPREFTKIGGFHKPIKLCAEAFIALSIDIRRHGYDIKFYDIMPSRMESCGFSRHNDGQVYLKTVFDHRSDPSDLKINMADRKRHKSGVLPIREYYEKHHKNFANDDMLRKRFRGKDLVILYPGVSLDSINLLNIYNYDYVFGIDFVGRIIKCDYVYTQELHILSDLLSVYGRHSLLVSDYVLDKMQNKYVYLNDITDKAHIIETTSDRESIKEAYQYYLDSDPLTCLTHMLVTAEPRLIQIIGADFNWRKGRSHVNSNYYNDGFMLEENEYNKDGYKRILKNISELGRLAESLGVTLLRNHNV